MQRSEVLAVVDFPLSLTGAFESGFGGDRDVGVERRVELFNAGKAVVGQFDGRDFAIAKFQAQFVDAKKHIILA